MKISAFFCFTALFLLCSAQGSARADDTPVFASFGGFASKLPVVAVHDAWATWAFQAEPGRVRRMVDCGLTNLTGAPNPSRAWLSLVSTQDVIGIKVFSAPGPNSGTRPAVVRALMEGLISAGVPPRNIVIWDRQERDLRAAGFADLARVFSARFAGAIQSGYDPNAFYDTPMLGTLVWGDLEFGKKGAGVGRKSFVTKLLTSDVTKIINVTPLLNHDAAGVCGNLYSLAFGSVDNTGRFETSPEALATAVPEIYALTNLSDRVVLNITDALLCQYEGSEGALLQYSTALNELRFSRDPVALDVLSLRDLARERKANHAPAHHPALDLYANASLLELGTSDLKKITVRKVEINQPAASTASTGLPDIRQR